MKILGIDRKPLHVALTGLAAAMLLGVGLTEVVPEKSHFTSYIQTQAADMAARKMWCNPGYVVVDYIHASRGPGAYEISTRGQCVSGPYNEPSAELTYAIDRNPYRVPVQGWLLRVTSLFGSRRTAESTPDAAQGSLGGTGRH